MIEVGNMVICVDDSDIREGAPKIKKGNKYIIESIWTCCDRIGYSVGTYYAKTEQVCCKTCKTKYYYEVCFYKPRRFRKIEPEYRTVEVSETINEQIKELIKN